VRVIRAGKDDLYTRAPELRGLAGKSVLIVGGGGLGSEAITGLGKLGLRRLVIGDGDLVDMAAAIRFGSATRFHGLPKAQALAQLANETQPYTEVTALVRHIGMARADGDPDMLTVIETQIEQADLVIDATAHVGVQHFLSDIARRLRTAYLQTEATRGVFAGLIALYPPDANVCWVCVQHHLTDGNIPELPATKVPDVQPAGCLDPTYAGTGFDLAAIAAQTVRCAASYLGSPDGSAPRQAEVVSVVLRDDTGAPSLPRWTAHDLPRHPRCENHNT
jgi:molybdopterin/thiamine biosynthesis adenylyltransferase